MIYGQVEGRCYTEVDIVGRAIPGMFYAINGMIVM